MKARIRIMRISVSILMVKELGLTSLYQSITGRGMCVTWGILAITSSREEKFVETLYRGAKKSNREM